VTQLLLAAISLDVTPPPGHRLDGYAARTGLATGAADPLRATIIWLSTADAPGVLWLSLDAIAVGKDLTAELAAAAGAAAGIPSAHVVVSASHTHSGPTGWTGEIHPVIPAERERDLVDALTSSVRAARLERRPVTASWRAIEVIGVGTNRHRRDGPHDNTVGILALHAPEGSLEALLLDFACHPTTYGPENLRYFRRLAGRCPGGARSGGGRVPAGRRRRRESPVHSSGPRCRRGCPAGWSARLAGPRRAGRARSGATTVGTGHPPYDARPQGPRDPIGRRGRRARRRGRAPGQRQRRPIRPDCPDPPRRRPRPSHDGRRRSTGLPRAAHQRRDDGGRLLGQPPRSSSSPSTAPACRPTAPTPSPESSATPTATTATSSTPPPPSPAPTKPSSPTSTNPPPPNS